MALSFGVAVLSPLGSSLSGAFAQVGIPAAIGLIAFQGRRPISLMLGLALLAGLLAGIVMSPASAWYVERGWAVLIGGGFAVATALGPGRPLFARVMTAVAIAGMVVVLAEALDPGLLRSLDLRLAGQYGRLVTAFELRGERWATVTEVLRATSAIARLVYPALLALSSLAALCVASYVMRRLEGVDAALPPLRGFRFGGYVAWLLIVGLGLFVLPAGDIATRLGANLMTFMGALYVLRGVAVLT